MNHVSLVERMRPGILEVEDGAGRPQVAILSEWNEYPGELVSRIEKLFSVRDKLPIVLVLDDVGDRTSEFRYLLTRLIGAGAVVLEAESEEQQRAVRADPLDFACALLAAASQAAGPTSSTTPPTSSTSPPSRPDGYEAFGTAFTRLSKKDMEDVIEGRRSDDWRYDS